MRIFRHVIRLFMYVLAGLAVLLAGYLLWLFLRTYGAPFVVITYACLSLIFLIIYVIGSFGAKFKSNPANVMVIASEAALRETSSTARLAVSKILDALALATAGWVSEGYYQVRAGIELARTKDTEQFRRKIASSALRGRGHYVALLALLITLASYVWAYAQPSAIAWMRLLLTIVLAHIITRHINYVIKPISLPVQLRRTIGNAYIIFIMIATADIASLTLILNSLFNWNSEFNFEIAATLEILRGLVFGNIIEFSQKILQGAAPNIKDSTLTGIAALLGLNLLETIYKFREFKRSDDDNLAIAATYVNLRQYVEALKTLDQITSYSAKFYTLRAIAEMGVLRADLAWADIVNAIGIQKSRSPNRRANASGPDHILLHLTSHFILINPSLPELVSVFKHASKNGASDICIALITLPVLIKFSEPELKSLKLTFDTPDFPATQSVLMLSLGDLTDAKSKVAEIAAKDDADAFLVSALRFAIDSSDPYSSQEEDREIFSKWSETALPLVTSLDLASLAEAKLILVADRLLSTLKYAELINSTYHQSWHYTYGNFRRHLPVTESGDYFLKEMEKIKL